MRLNWSEVRYVINIQSKARLRNIVSSDYQGLKDEHMNCLSSSHCEDALNHSATGGPFLIDRCYWLFQLFGMIHTSLKGLFSLHTEHIHFGLNYFGRGDAGHGRL